MLIHIPLKGVALCLLLLSNATVSGGIKAQGQICSKPSNTCQTKHVFESYQLPFKIKQEPVFGQTFKSAYFYAVILKSVKVNEASECSYVAENERLEVQVMFPDRKVFASRFFCPEELILYTNVNQDYNFLAIYAGATKAEAMQVLAKVKATGRYPQANIRRMQVVLEFST